MDGVIDRPGKCDDIVELFGVDPHLESFGMGSAPLIYQVILDVFYFSPGSRHRAALRATRDLFRRTAKIY